MRLIHCFFFLISFFAGSFVYAKDCQGVKPFRPMGRLSAQVTVFKLSTLGDGSDQEICTGTLSISTYDVRGREEEAFYCLHPESWELLSCKTTVSSEPADIFIVPASWVRSATPSDVREYRFHAYVMKATDPDFFYDVYSRVLSFQLPPQPTILEGALKMGPNNSGDGYFVRVDFGPFISDR